MTAMVGPIGIHHPHLGNGRIAMLGIPEISLQKLQIIQIHRQPQGAATCIGGCIRDPLSGRAYVHQAMRVTGCGDPRAPFADTLPGKPIATETPPAPKSLHRLIIFVTAGFRNSL